jgi:hypothetical protein
MTITYDWRGDFENAALTALHAEGFGGRGRAIDWRAGYGGRGGPEAPPVPATPRQTGGAS